MPQTGLDKHAEARYWNSPTLCVPHSLMRHTVCLAFSLFQFHSLVLPYFSPSNPPYYRHYLQCLLQKADHLWFLNPQEARKSNLNTDNKFKREMDTKSHSIQIRQACIQVHVPAWQFVYTVLRQSEFNWQSVEINGNEERFAESRVVITHAIGFDSPGMWLIFPCFYHHSISVGTVMCMPGNTGDWPR